jgi:hypothetical protein
LEFSQVGGLYNIDSNDKTSAIYAHVHDSRDLATLSLISDLGGSISVSLNDTASYNVQFKPAYTDTTNHGLPPSSAMSFLKKKSVPAIVFGDFKDSFSNK